MERLIAKMGINFKNGPTPFGGAVPNPANKRRYAFSAVAFLAALAVGLLFLLPGGLLQAQDDGMIEYPENSTAVVATFSATDPDMDDIMWSLSGTDDDAFTIDGETGELKFNTPPDYESPAGGSDSDSNTYEITVTASDGDETTPLTAMKAVMVKVIDVEERATIELSARQPVVGQTLMATLMNDDEVASGVRWTWEKKDGTSWVDVAGTPASTDATGTEPYTGTYTPMQSEINAELRVDVEYIDTDNDNLRVGAKEFEQAVAASVGGTNVAPTFPGGTTASRTVAENAAAGTPVGDPVTAMDDHRTALTYTLTNEDDDSASDEFEIDWRTGQIRVREGAELNYDVATADERTYTLTVAVPDPDNVGGAAAEATVTVMVTDVAEAPKVTGPDSKMVMEEATEVDTYSGTDEAGDAIGLTLEGADAAAFGLTPDGDGDYDLAFNAPPDFEMPTDTGSNNEYQVTVAATDRGLKTTQSVVVRVTNIEEAGEIELTPMEPTVGMPVMAELTDDDMVQARTVTWLWSSNDETACDENTTFERGDRIAGTTSDTYTPMADECLRVTARYADGHGGNKNAMKTVTVGARTSNMPVFGDDDPIIRSVEENADTVPTNVGAPVTATDADTEGAGTDTLTYTIESVDPSSGTARFGINNTTGQLQAEEMLDHEEQASYMLEVKVTDSTGNSAMVTVTVMVNDVNDDPGAIMDSRRNNDYAENRTDPVATFSSEDPDGDDIIWSLESGDDSASFTIDGESGELKFNTPPNYEMPRGTELSDTNTNTYEITVTATDDQTPGLTAMKAVMVKVTDVEERATIELSTRQPVVGQAIMATLMNDDEVVNDVRWTWTGIAGTPTDTQTSSTYTPEADDANDSVRVGVKYIDTDDREQTVAAVAFEQPVAPSLAVGVTSNAPTFAEGATAMRTIAENAAAGTAVGNPVTATDDHRTALTYQLSTSTQFEIDRRTGQIRVREGAELNYDVVAERTHTLTVTVPDPDGGTAGTIEVTVNVTDVPEAPKVTGPASGMVEEGMTTVGTYMGRDEAGGAIGLTLEGADASAFRLTRDSDGDYDLAFRTAPDFEMPTDTDSNNEYQVTVAATDRGLKTTQSVVVRVRNMNEAGAIKLTPEARTVGMPVMAELSDDDVVLQARTVTWLWSSKTDTGNCDDTDDTTFLRGDRIAGATSDTYTPTAVGCLRVTARYTDGHGGNKNAMATVQVEARTSNMPVFTEDDPIIRSVNENAVVGTDVGEADAAASVDPVVATDADNSPTTSGLTYTIESVTPSSGAARFSIDNTGQLVTEEMLDHEEEASYMLEVKVSDSRGNSAMVTVTVNVNDVNEMPVIIVGGLSIRGPSSVNYAENDMDAVAMYTLAGQMKDMATWSLVVESDDAGDFMITDGMLTFRSAPDYENPTDADMDNVYMVTIMANDGTYRDTHDVMVIVTNVEDTVTSGEDMGEVTLWAGTDVLTMAPQVGETITGAVMDPDGGVTVQSWQWARTMDTADTSSWVDIQGATNVAYMVTAGDAGYHLRVMATYTDAVGTDTAMVHSMPTMMVTAVGEDPLPSDLQKFDLEDDGIDEDDVVAAIVKHVTDGDYTEGELVSLIVYFVGLPSS